MTENGPATGVCASTGWHNGWERGNISLPSTPSAIVPVNSRCCMYPKIPIGLTVTKHDGLLSLPGTNNLRALPLVKYLALFFQGWVNPVICSLSSLRQQWKRDSPSGSSPKSHSLWVPCYPMQPQAESQDQPTFLFGVFQMCVLLAKLDGPRWLGTPWSVAGSPLVLMSYFSPAFY